MNRVTNTHCTRWSLGAIVALSATGACGKSSSDAGAAVAGGAVASSGVGAGGGSSTTVKLSVAVTRAGQGKLTAEAGGEAIEITGNGFSPKAGSVRFAMAILRTIQRAPRHFKQPKRCIHA